jgi:hypothetical protein
MTWQHRNTVAVLASCWLSLLLLLRSQSLLMQNFVRSTEFFSRVAVIYGAYKTTQLRAAVMRLQGSKAEPHIKVCACSVSSLSSCWVV